MAPSCVVDKAPTAFPRYSFAAASKKGLQRLEGKDYVVQDGDIIHFRFNVAK